MNVWGRLSANPYPDGKVHQSAVKVITDYITAMSTMEDIYRRVVSWGITDDMDALATSRALWAIRDEMRMAAERAQTS